MTPKSKESPMKRQKSLEKQKMAKIPKLIVNPIKKLTSLQRHFSGPDEEILKLLSDPDFNSAKFSDFK